MITGVGVDIVQVERMRKKAGEGLDTPLAKGVFTSSELEYARGKGVAAAQSLAGFFAAREALFKATQVWPGWHGAWVEHDQRGRPYFMFSDEAVGKYAHAGICVAAPEGGGCAQRQGSKAAPDAAVPLSANVVPDTTPKAARCNIQLTISHEKDFAVAMVVVVEND